MRLCADSDSGDELALPAVSDLATFGPAASAVAAASQSAVALVQQADPSSLICFRVSHKRPSGRKRPTSHRDDVGSADVVLAQYQIVKQCPDELTVTAIHASDPALSRVLDGPAEEMQKVQEAMTQWQAVSLDDMTLTAPPGLTDSEERVLTDVFDALAFVGGSVYFDGNGYPAGSDFESSLTTLLAKGIIFECQHEHRQVQLLPKWVQCHNLILRNPQKVFSIRAGIPFDADLITKNVKPTALEVQLRMAQAGWELKQGNRRSWSQLFDCGYI